MSLAVPRLMFVYGTLQSPEVYSKVVLGRAELLPQLRYRRAVVHGARRAPVRGHDYPAMYLTGCGDDRVEGRLVTVDDVNHVRRLDVFEGAEYVRRTVTATVLEGEDEGREVQADAYLWVGGPPEETLDLASDWSLEKFQREKMHVWVGGDETRACI